MEKLRKRLILSIVLTLLIMLALVLVSVYSEVPGLILFALVLGGFGLSYIFYRIMLFKARFKPAVIPLVLDFFDNEVNYGSLRYHPKGFLSLSVFRESGIFVNEVKSYKGEDKIEGKIGELPFSVCELDVREVSRVGHGLTKVFRGVFMKAELNIPLQGQLMLLPRSRRPYLTRSIKAFSARGGKNIDERLDNESFRKLFMTYTTSETPYQRFLFPEMQNALADYCETTGRDVYISVVDAALYMAVAVPKDLLEPLIWRSNTSFRRIHEYFQDLRLMTGLIEVVDAHN